MFETTLIYQMMAERYPNLKEKIGGSIPDCEISSLLDGKLAKWSTASCALALACRPSVSQKRKKKKKKNSLRVEFHGDYRGQCPAFPTIKFHDA
jgi:hypothetical protein